MIDRHSRLGAAKDWQNTISSRTKLAQFME